ncbi:MAG TPA: hypothetical protein DIS79_11325 [Bacteroidetes bacterium]|nr:hypothetical protein [Bacteroidota bacterium]HRK03825.1 hypothetical protein [Chlorobiota bacterium]
MTLSSILWTVASAILSSVTITMVSHTLFEQQNSSILLTAVIAATSLTTLLPSRSAATPERWYWILSMAGVVVTTTVSALAGTIVWISLLPTAGSVPALTVGVFTTSLLTTTGIVVRSRTVPASRRLLLVGVMTAIYTLIGLVSDLMTSVAGQ